MENQENQNENILDNKERAYATGKRKNSIARVWLKRGSGEIKINGKPLDKYFSRPVLQMIVNQPLDVVKADNKIYYRHTGYPGGIKETTPNKMKEKNKSDEMIKLAIKRMIPRGPLGRQQLSNCKIYRDENHKHEAQNPQIIDIASMNTKNKI